MKTVISIAQQRRGVRICFETPPFATAAWQTVRLYDDMTNCISAKMCAPIQSPADIATTSDSRPQGETYKICKCFSCTKLFLSDRECIRIVFDNHIHICSRCKLICNVSSVHPGRFSVAYVTRPRVWSTQPAVAT